MSDHGVRTWTACRRIFSSDHFEEGFESGNVAYLQLSRSTPALRKVSVLVLVLVSQSNPLGLLHYRLISDVLSSGAMVSALLIDVGFILEEFTWTPFNKLAAIIVYLSKPIW